MAETKRRQAFWEIGFGKLGRDFQIMYEDCANLASESGQAISLALKITIKPPMEENIGGVCYEMSHTVPKKRSTAYEARFDNGLIITTGSLDIPVEQESLEFPEYSFKPAKENRS